MDLRGKIAIIGIAKRLEEIFYPGDSFPLYLDKKSETLKIIQQLRNEAHRFGITFHRNKRSSTALNTELEEIPGIGEKTVVELLKNFRSLKRIKEASWTALPAVIGQIKGRDHIQPLSPLKNEKIRSFFCFSSSPAGHLPRKGGAKRGPGVEWGRGKRIGAYWGAQGAGRGRGGGRLYWRHQYGSDYWRSLCLGLFRKPAGQHFQETNFNILIQDELPRSAKTFYEKRDAEKYAHYPAF